MKLKNYGAKRRNQEKNLFVKRLKIILSGSLVVFLFTTTTYTIADFSIQSQTLKEKQQIAVKVSRIMWLYHCENPQIHAAIMNTFDPILVAMIIGIESEYKIDTISPAGCRGLMQLSPDKLEDWKNVTKNIQVGALFLEEQLQRFGSIELAIAAYNAGPESVVKFKGVPPYRETQNYIYKTRNLSSQFYPRLFTKTGTVLPVKWHPDLSKINN